MEGEEAEARGRENIMGRQRIQEELTKHCLPHRLTQELAETRVLLHWQHLNIFFSPSSWEKHCKPVVYSAEERYVSTLRALTWCKSLLETRPR